MTTPDPDPDPSPRLETVEGHRAVVLPVDGRPRQVVIPVDPGEQRAAIARHVGADLAVPVLATWCAVWIAPQHDALPRNERATEFVLRGLRGDVVVTGLTDADGAGTDLTVEQVTHLVEATRPEAGA